MKKDKWSHYLTCVKFIANKLGLTTRAILHWKQENHVPEWHFEALQPVLVSLGHEIRLTEMRELNDGD